MKNKKLLVLLLLLVIGIWGTIIYRFTQTINHTDKTIVSRSEIESRPQELSVDTFNIIGDYRDPFLGKRAVPAVATEKVSPKVKPLQPQPVIIKWPVINFMGVIRNQNSEKELALVKIDQKDFIMKSGEIKMGIELSKIYKDSILVSYQKEKKTVVK